MEIASRLAQKIRNGEYDSIFSALYWPDAVSLAKQRARYIEAVENFERIYGAHSEVALYSVPGRIELCGNHTDHNNGIVMASAVNLDMIAVVSKSDIDEIRLHSKEFDFEYVVDLSELEPDETEFGSSSAMIRGVAAGIREQGGVVGGFDAYVASDVLKGSGLSSSAAFEICVAVILNEEYNGGRFDPVSLGIIGQFSENVYFGKPSGLMDQTACSVGGVISIDLKKPSAPVVTKVPMHLSAHGLYLVVTDTKGDHSNLTGEYSAIRREMEQVALFFDKKCLREVNYEDFLSNIAEVRIFAGDRAVLRAIHFFEECRRVSEAIEATAGGDIARFLSLIIECGNSSFEYNQNAYSIASPEKQGVSLALAISQVILRGRGAWRLQGGGFAGTIQAFVPSDLINEYCSAMRSVFGEDACYVLQFRERGAFKVIC
jgi:galactokinase